MDIFKKMGGIVGCVLLTVPTYAEIKVNEVMPCNISTYMDKSVYDFPGWIELYNDGETESLKGYTLKHYKIKKGGAKELKYSWEIKEDIKVESESYCLIFCDEENVSKHAPFKLDSDGGTVELYKGDKAIDVLKYGAMDTHISYGRSAENVGYMNPTPKKANTGAYRLEDRVSKPEFSGKHPGVVSGDIKITLNCKTGGAPIYYTTDGSEPTQESSLYDGDIPIASTTIIKARAFLEDKPASEILTGTFLYVDSRHADCGGYTVPIVSISTNIDYFEDPQIGIAVVGENGLETDLGCLNEVGIHRANFLQDWRRPVVFEYIENDSSVMAHEMEAGIIGGCSRKNSVQSLKFKAGSRVGSTKKYLEVNPFADRPGNKYSSLHLRNGGNAYDASMVRVRDGYMQALSKPMNLDYQAYQPVAYYLNGEYKGLMGLRERTNKDYVEANYGLDEDEIDHMEVVNESGVEATQGTLDWYNELVKFLETEDPKSEKYFETACKYMDMDEYIDFQLFEHFIVNTDWPGNNAKIWRDRKNGKLRWIIFDTDFGLGIYHEGYPNYCDVKINFIEWASGTGSKVNWANGAELSKGYEFNEEAKWKTTIFYHLLKNPEFQEKFVNKTLIHLGTTFTNDRVQDVWDSLLAVVENEYCAFTKGGNLGSMDGVASMLKFAKERPQYMYDYTATYFGLGEYVNLNYSSNVEGAKFLMNGDLVNFSSYQGRFVSGRPLKLEAIAPSGYKFSHWEIKDNSSFIPLMGESTSWKYFYQSESPESEWKRVDFDDSEWLDGKGKMGYRVAEVESETNAGFNTILDFGEDPDNKYMRAYFRSTFEISDKSKLKELLVNMVYDDGYIFYLNGKEIRRQKVAENLKEGEEYADPHSNDDPDEFSISLEDVVNGKNVVAIMVCQNTLTSSDLTLKLSMKAEKNEEEGVVKDERKIFAADLADDVHLEAVFEEYKCEDMIRDYSVLVLNEVAPSNDSSTNIFDEYGVHSDWFEIYNSGDDTLDLAGLYLSDDEANLGKSLIPFTHPDSTKIAPKGFVRFWADNATYRGVLHADFKLSNTDPTGLFLSVNCGSQLSEVASFWYKSLPQNASMGYLEEGSDRVTFDNTIFKENDSVVFISCATPGASNILCQEEKTIVVDEPITESEVQIYPNPTESDLNIRSTSDKILSVQIYDGMGRLLLEQKEEGEEVQVDMDRLATGTYYLQILTSKEVLQKKVIKL